jgi:hypothetical protein
MGTTLVLNGKTGLSPFSKDTAYVYLNFYLITTFLSLTERLQGMRSGEHGGQFSVPPQTTHQPGKCAFRYRLTFLWNAGVIRHTDITSAIVLVEERSLLRPAVYIERNQGNCHDVGRRCTVQSASHQWHHATCLQRTSQEVTFHCFVLIAMSPYIRVSGNVDGV